MPYPDVEAELNRWLPLVKWFLAIPHYVVLILLDVAVMLAAVGAWFAILFTGRYPRSLFRFTVGAAQRILKGSGPWRSVPREVKGALMEDLTGLLPTFSTPGPFGLIAVVRAPLAVPKADPIERIYEELALRFNSFVRKGREGSVNHKGMFVGDEATFPGVRAWRRCAGCTGSSPHRARG